MSSDHAWRFTFLRFRRVDLFISWLDLARSFTDYFKFASVTSTKNSVFMFRGKSNCFCHVLLVQWIISSTSRLSHSTKTSQITCNLWMNKYVLICSSTVEFRSLRQSNDSRITSHSYYSWLWLSLMLYYPATIETTYDVPARSCNFPCAVHQATITNLRRVVCRNTNDILQLKWTLLWMK